MTAGSINSAGSTGQNTRPRDGNLPANGVFQGRSVALRDAYANMKFGTPSRVAKNNQQNISYEQLSQTEKLQIDEIIDINSKIARNFDQLAAMDKDLAAHPDIILAAIKEQHLRSTLDIFETSFAAQQDPTTPASRGAVPLTEAAAVFEALDNTIVEFNDVELDEIKKALVAENARDRSDTNSGLLAGLNEENEQFNEFQDQRVEKVGDVV